MNYYIQGSPARAEEIKAAFGKLGYDVLDFGFADKTVVYCSIGGYGGCVQCLPYSINLMNILHSHPDYKELELPVEFKDGDIIGFNDCTHNDGSYVDWVGIYKQGIETNQHLFHCVIPSCRSFRVGGMWRVFTAYPATKEQRDLLFKKMKEAGYEWDAEKKELRKIQPHYDIANFKVGMPVLVRDYDNTQWRYVQFSHCVGKDNPIMFNACGNTWRQCIPFEGNEHLLGTTEQCDECYINW